MPRFSGFSLPEVAAAVVILGLVSTGVLVVINRCASSAIDSSLRMQAFEVARNNMEKLLASEAVQEMSDNGISDKYPEIEWQIVVESFYEPITARMWIKGVCSAEYTDMAGEVQKVELTHWLTDVTKQQLLEILRQQREEERLAEQIIETIEEAAEYAGVDVGTIEQWIDNGMLTTDDGSFIKDNLDLYNQAGGSPTPEQKQQQRPPDLIEPTAEQPAPGDELDWLDEVDPVTGLSYRELNNMDISDIMAILREKFPQLFGPR